MQAFISRLVKQDGFERAWLEKTLASAQKKDAILAAIAKPYESKPWYQYESLFVNETRVNAGVNFWDMHVRDLANAQQKYGVPASIIIAVLGVESFYGRQKGGYPVLDTLTTLAFDYPSRAAFFQNELEQYLLLCREQSFDPASLTGSYAGAMGAPQFMPDSYRQYAVTAASGSHPDIWDNWADIINSVANYFHIHGWKPGGLVALPAALPTNQAPPATLVPTTIGSLRQQGLIVSAGLDAGTPVILVPLQMQNDIQYWVGFDNFRVITQYNKSPLYAMAVFDLSARIAETRALEEHADPP
ncbi:MAG: lytic murein transglycosylase B [Gammaproteobacteria bacterium]|nr:lytic murein transglycosylase B [Gammaproteobacteria bacterium]